MNSPEVSVSAAQVPIGAPTVPAGAPQVPAGALAFSTPARVAAPSPRLAWTIALVLTAAYCAVFAQFSAQLPFQDYPNHLARAVVLADLLFHQGHAFAGVFHYHFLAIPYVLGDLLLAGAIAVCGLAGGAAVWNVLVFVSLPASLLFYLRVLNASSATRALALILSLYLSTDWFFVKGFFAFRLAIAMILIGMAMAQWLRQRSSIALAVAYVVVLMLGYLVHLTVPVFQAAAIGTSGLLALARGRSSLRREFAILLPLALIFVWQFGVTPHYRLATDTNSDYYEWGTVRDKFVDVGLHFMRYNARLDYLLLAALAVCVFWPAQRLRAAFASQSAVPETLLLALMFLVLYVVLPVGYADAWWVDVRAAEFATLMLVVAGLLLRDADTDRRRSAPALIVALAGLLAVGNLGYLAKHMVQDREWVRAYREVIAALPEHARVLPVHTRPREGLLYPFLHVGSFVVIDREGLTPYLFSGDGGFPMRYFRYIERPYAPDDGWYKAHASADWQRIACSYGYLLVTKPFEARRIPLPTIPIADNASATLLQVPSSECASSRIAR